MGHGVAGRTTISKLDAAAARELAQTMQALATPSRLLILGRLRESPCTVNELAATIEMDPSAVSHQLRVLRHLRIVVGERRGRNVLYLLHDGHVATLLDQAISHLEHVRLDYPDRLERTG